MNDNKKVVKRKRKKLKVGYVLAAVAILLAIIVGIKMIIPTGSSKYGDRLDGIKKIKFGKEEKDKIIKKIKSSDKVTEAKIDVQGKRIDIIFYVTKETSLEDARNIANSSLGEISNEVKGFYDVQYMIDKKTKDRDENDKSFPDMGYKNAKSQGIVW